MQTLDLTVSFVHSIPFDLPLPADIDIDIRVWRGAHPQFDAHLAQGFAPAKALRHLGLTAWSGGNPAFAVAVLKAAIALAPDDASLWADLSGAFYACAMAPESRACLLHSLERNEHDAGRWLFLAGLYRDAQEIVEAERAFLRAVAIDPLLHDAWVGLGILYFQSRRFAQSVEALRLALRHGSRDMVLHACLGEALYLLGRISPAADAYAVQVQRSPHEAKIVQKYAFIRFLEGVIAGPLDEAIALYRVLAGEQAQDTETLVQNAFHVLSGYGFREAALRCGRVHLERTPEDPVQRYLVSVLEGAKVSRAPDDYLIRYFDQFADNFDYKLVDVLEYRVPQKLQALVAATGRSFSHCLDAGCGTGLAGALLRPLAKRLTGIDLSSRMLEKAVERTVYDQLIQAEIDDFLDTTTDKFDLIFAADVIIYFGDLAMLMVRMARALTPNGIFAFSVETGDTADYAVLPSGRFAHHPAYVEQVARGLFSIEKIIVTQLRLDATRPVAGMMFVLRKQG